MLIKKKLEILAMDDDRVMLEPIVKALTEKGIRITEENGHDKNTVLVALSEKFYNDKYAVNRLLTLIGSGEERVLPLQLDTIPVPNEIKSALYSRNIIPAAGRDASLVAERIDEAIPVQKLNLPKLFIIAGILVVIICAVIILVSSNSETSEPEQVTVDAEPGKEKEVVLPKAIADADLSSIEDIAIIGDQIYVFTKEDYLKYGRWPRIDYVAYDYTDDEGNVKWVSKENGKEYKMTHYNDLSYLGKLTELKNLALVNVDTKNLPDMSGLGIDFLQIYDCNIDNLDWLSNTEIGTLEIRPLKNIDLSPLKGLVGLYLDLRNVDSIDFSNFDTLQFDAVCIKNGDKLDSIDLSAFNKSSVLRELNIQDDVPVTDLDFIQNLGQLKYLRLERCNKLKDISAVGTLKTLTELTIWDCPLMSDYSVLTDCTSLNYIFLENNSGNTRVLYNGNKFVLDGLTKLKEIHLGGFNLDNLDFLGNLSYKRTPLFLEIYGRINDYSGLQNIERFDNLSIERPEDGDYSRYLPYIKNAQINTLSLSGCDNLDFGLLPENVNKLDLSGVRSLNSIKTLKVEELSIHDSDSLKSLSGIENVSSFFDGSNANLILENCPSLYDYSALSGAQLGLITIARQYILPDFASFKTNEIRLEYIPNLTDVSCFDSISDDAYLNIWLVGLDSLTDLSALGRLRGRYLAVPPQVMGQAEALVEAGNFKSYSVEYPESGWEPYEIYVELTSLEDLEKMPAFLLHQVESLCMVGDKVIVNGWPGEEWEEGAEKPIIVFNDWETGDKTPIEYGEGISDLSVLKDLTGLKWLTLFDQPIENLEGIQDFKELESFEIRDCDKLTDFTAAYSCTNLRNISVSRCPIESLDGIQNLRNLVFLRLEHTEITDISPLEQVDYFTSASEEGFELWIGDFKTISDFTPLSAVPKYKHLDLSCQDAALFVPYLKESEIYKFNGNCCFQGKDADQLFAEFINDHPEIEELYIPHNDGITDFTILLELKNLKYVHVSGKYNMKDAIESLEGKDYQFEFELEE